LIITRPSVAGPSLSELEALCHVSVAGQSQLEGFRDTNQGTSREDACTLRTTTKTNQGQNTTRKINDAYG
jgi:hypothetical protein